MFSYTLLGLVGILAFLWYRQRKRCLLFFKNLGIPGPEPNILFGNFFEIFRKGPLKCQKEWAEKYGRIIGYYYGTDPVLLVSDVNLLKSILIKDFQKFADRTMLFQEVNKTLTSNDRRNLNLINLKGASWKEVRSLVTPAFTTGKMKLMSPIMVECIDSLLENIEEQRQSRKSFELYTLLRRLTMDVIGRTAFGIQTNVQKNSRDPFLKLAYLILPGSGHFSALLVGSVCAIIDPVVTFVRSLIAAIKNTGYNPVEELLDRCEGVIKARMKNPSLKRLDLLQLMIDAEVRDDGKISEKSLAAGEEMETQDDSSVSERDTGKNEKKRHLTIDQMVANSFLFLLAGYETTSTALAFSVLMLVNYPEVQEKIRCEVNDLLEKEGKLTYESVNQLGYLDEVLCEVLRLYPPVYQFVNRATAEDVVYDNIRIPKGTIVQMATYLLHYDPEYWPDPHEFKPERFSPENRKKNVPLAWQPFGAGPRNCVGLRFAQMEAKLAIAKMLHKYRLLPTKETSKHPLELDLAPLIMRPKYGVPIRAELV